MAIAFCAAAFCGTAGAQPSEADEEVLVRRVVPRDYHEPSVAPEKLSTYLSNSLRQALVVKPGQTLSGILQQQFGVTPAWTPQVYEQFEAHVRQANAIADPARDLKAGQVLLLPDMPRGAQTATSPRGNLATQAQVTFSKVGSDALLVTPPTPVNAASEVAPTAVQVRSMKRSQYAALKVNPQATRRELEASAQFVPLQGAIVAKLAAGGTPGGDALDDRAKAALAGFMQRPPRTRPYVVVLDDSWPSQDDFRHAAKFVIEASRQIRRAYSLQDETHGDSADIKTLEAEMGNGTNFCDAHCEYPQLKWHSAMVRRSMEELRALDSHSLVEVIYLPLNRSQRYASNVLAEMMRVTLLADSVTSQLVLATGSGNLPADVQPGIPDYEGVDAMVKTMLKPPRLGTIPPAYLPGAELQVSTDKAIVDAVVNFMVLYSAASQRPHFLSMSWTTPPNTLPALFRQDAYGLWIAAAGNDANVNVHAQGAQFAARSGTPGDFIAVQNTAAAGCDTSTLSDNPMLHVYGIAYPGRIDATHCGTSFSAPRVAWLLAAREAVKGTAVKPAPTDAWTQWQKLRMESLFSLTRPQAHGEERYRMTMWQLLEEPAP